MAELKEVSSAPILLNSLETCSCTLFGDDRVHDGWDFRELDDWDSLAELLREAQTTKTPLWMSRGPLPTADRGILASFSSQTVLPQPRLDRDSLLMHCDTRHTLETLESFARVEGLTAGFRPHPTKTLLEWLQQSYVTVMDTCSGEPVSRMYSCHGYLPDGEKIRLGRSPRAAVGPDLKTLFWGSCGVLGVVSQVSLRLRQVSSSMTFWRLKFPQWTEMVTFLHELIRCRQFPVDARAELTSPDDGVTLSLRINPDQTPLAQLRCQEHSESLELMASHFGEPRRKPFWLRLSAPWGRLKELPTLAQRSCPFELLSLTLVHLTHGEGIVLAELGQDIPVQQRRLLLLQWVQELEKQGIHCKADNRFLPWSVLHPFRAELLGRIKRELDPAFVLNSHLFVGE